MLIEKNLSFFFACDEPQQGNVGTPPKFWTDRFCGPLSFELEDRKLDRREMRMLCADPATSELAIYVNVMAWGDQGRGVQLRHAASAWARHRDACRIIRKLRTGGLTAAAAYDEFRTADILGLGPSFFTKLIAFAHPGNDRLIMDQWTGKSVNILTRQGLVSFAGTSPSRKNCGQDYGKFCDVIGTVAAIATTRGLSNFDTPWKVEERMFSHGGRKKGPWRQYVIDNWPLDCR